MLIRKRFGASAGIDFCHALKRSVRTKPTVINVITPSPRQAICSAVDKRRRSRLARPYAHDRAPPSIESFPERTKRRISHSSATANSVAAPTSATMPPTKMAPVLKSCDCIITTDKTAAPPSTIASAPPPEAVGMSRRKARTGGVADNATRGGMAKPNSSTRPVANALTNGNHPAGGNVDANKPRTANAKPACAAKAMATPSTQAISASTKN